MMKLRTLRDWISAKESTSNTRARRHAALELGPVSTAAASLYGHSTLPPGVTNKLKKKLTRQIVKNDIWDIPEEERSPDYSFDKWIQSAMEKAKELADSKKSAEDEDEKLDKEIESRLKDKVKEEDKPEAKSPQEKEDDDEETGKDSSRWTGHKKEREDQEKAGIGPTAGRKPS